MCCIQGDEGDPGTDGSQGDKGDPGSQGPQGRQGLNGVAGGPGPAVCDILLQLEYKILFHPPCRAFKVRLVLKDLQVQKELLDNLASLVHKEIKEIQGNRYVKIYHNITHLL